MSARQAYQWINRIQQKFNALAGLKLSPQKKERLQQWLETEFVYNTLLLEGGTADREALAQIVRAAPAPQPSSGESPLPEALLHRFRLIEDSVESRGAEARLSVDWLRRLAIGEELRRNDTRVSAVRAEHLPMIVENACRWFAMASFAELNPVEQAAIALLRLLEIAPFADHNQSLALIAASLFTRRSGLPPVIFRPLQQQAYLAAVQQGLRMNTQPMVEVVAAAIEQTLDEMLDFHRAEG